MDEQQAKRMNEAAQKFADALIESYRAVSERSAEAQERQVRLAESFFESATNRIRVQAETGDAAARELAEQARRGQEASQTLARESADAYMDFLNSMFSYYQRSAEEAEKTAGSKPSRTR
jgi:transglutaminase-like putative cysteine protease